MGLNEPVLVLGCNGMLGRAFCELLDKQNGDHVSPEIDYDGLDLPDVDFTEPSTIPIAVRAEYGTVINCAAYTDVDGAETHQDLAYQINARAVGVLARRCAAIGAKLVHFSTDYVFDGQGAEPYPVGHLGALPLNVYGRSKAAGELAVWEVGASALLLIRTSGLYAPWGKNFVRTMRARMLDKQDDVRVVNDQVGRPTSAQYLAERTLALLRCGAEGVFHVTDGGEPCSWFDIASEIAEPGFDTVVPCSTGEYPALAKRPAYSVLDLSRVEALLGPSRPWQDNLRDVLAQLK